jgi:hypothetical protein
MEGFVTILVDLSAVLSATTTEQHSKIWIFGAVFSPNKF